MPLATAHRMGLLLSSRGAAPPLKFTLHGCRLELACARGPSHTPGTPTSAFSRLLVLLSMQLLFHRHSPSAPILPVLHICGILKPGLAIPTPQHAATSSSTSLITKPRTETLSNYPYSGSLALIWYVQLNLCARESCTFRAFCHAPPSLAASNFGYHLALKRNLATPVSLGISSGNHPSLVFAMEGAARTRAPAATNYDVHALRGEMLDLPCPRCNGDSRSRPSTFLIMDRPRPGK